MDPGTGDVWPLRESVLGDTETGSLVDMHALREAVSKLEDATSDEIEASLRERLVLVEEEVARRLKLGAREQRRRQKRRKK